MQLLSSIPAIITIEMPPQVFSFLVGINFVQFDVGGIIGLPCIDQGDAFEAYKLDLYIMGGLCGAWCLSQQSPLCEKQDAAQSFAVDWKRESWKKMMMKMHETKYASTYVT